MTGARLQAAVQAEPFVAEALQAALLEPAAGAVVTFTGYVRAASDGAAVTALELEHYPGMTERSLLSILQQASSRWPLLAATVVHRVGWLPLGEPIVWVGSCASHRGDAFAACEFVMDYLKTDAPFWKKEHGPDGARWVESRATDAQRARRW
ncbi:molybdenum cofactor biosynthesis protein MoaE [Kineobactrum salinum]|uniref:Molybdopterin synthase catalytic subunit n=1 Tax=Kineobactrum salinum TaxID=2708301 RepID=A0A6C0U4R3_9GAMM|nr:molybdenum cofactor biosynthesis protein MoaE [Kineobactrum salinum]QIB67091.1 molybdenum cofactor biosynthesis protein MoaE [Kineobactrum salinum]